MFERVDCYVHQHPRLSSAGQGVNHQVYTEASINLGTSQHEGCSVCWGVAFSTPILLADVYPTIAARIGVPPQEDLAGIDLASVVGGTATREAIVVYNTFSAMSFKVVVTEQWRFIDYQDETV